MSREQRLRDIQKVFSSMPSDLSGEPNDQEIAMLDKLIEQNLIQVEKTE